MGSGRLLIVGVILLFILCTGVSPGVGYLMGGMLDSSSTLLHLSSLMYIKDDSISFASSCFNSLGNWFVCLAILACLMLVKLSYAFTEN